MKRFIYTLLLSLIIVNINAQKKLKLESINVCNEIQIISESDYFKNKISSTKVTEKTDYRKTKGKIIIPFKSSHLIFKDNLKDLNYFEYTIIGEHFKNKWILVLGQDYNQNYYYLINQNCNKVDTLVGEPKIFKDRILCQEGSYTDGTGNIEIWSIINGELKLSKRFSFNPCKIFAIDELYLNNNFLFVKYNFKKFFKLDLERIKSVGCQ